MANSPAQPRQGSTPLSSMPSTPEKTVTPPGSSRPTQLSEGTTTSAASSLPEIEATESSAAAKVASSEPQASPPTRSDMAKKRIPKPTSKRNRDEDKEECSPQPKKVASSPKAKAKGNKKSATRSDLADKPSNEKLDSKKLTPAPPPPSTRPSRTRKAPERFGNLEEPKTTVVTPVRKGVSKVFDPTFITTNSTSRLGKADVYHMLLEPAAWSSLDVDQQKTLISMLPPCFNNTALLNRTQAGISEDTRPHAFTINNDCFRTDVAKFKEDLKNGHLAKTWQCEAEQAVIERAAGDYDAWKAEEAERWWGQKDAATM